MPMVGVGSMTDNPPGKIDDHDLAYLCKLEFTFRLEFTLWADMSLLSPEFTSSWRLEFTFGDAPNLSP